MATEKAGGMSAEAVHKATGRTWDEWFALLDADGAAALPHPQIVMLVSQKHGAPDWWSQMVTVAYEQERGLREKHQQTDGYTASRSKTVGIPVTDLFAAWLDPQQRSLWLPDAPLTVRKSTEPKSMRMRWEADGSSVTANFTAKGESRSQVAIEHSRLPDADSGQSMREFWSAALQRMKDVLEESANAP